MRDTDWPACQAQSRPPIGFSKSRVLRYEVEAGCGCKREPGYAPRRWRLAPKIFAPALWLVVLAVLVSPVAAQAAGNVYVTTAGVAQYAIGAGGLLSPLSPPTVAAGESPRAIAVTPDGKSVYVTNFFGNTVSQYDVDASSRGRPPRPSVRRSLRSRSAR